MTSDPEVEIKFVVADPKKLLRGLKKIGFRLRTSRTHEMNTLYDFPGQPLRKRGELLRLRKYGTKWTMTHKAKGRPGRHKSRPETEISVDDGKKAETILVYLGLQPIFRYEKFRAEWSDGAGHLVIDETPIGTYAELEGPPRWIDRTAKRLGIAGADYITKTYAQLFGDWKQGTRSPAEEMTFKAVRRRGRSR
jgi:adenylate cyclase, class 2